MADISSNEPGANVQAYAEAGFEFIAIKATEGLSYVNPFHRGWSLQAGLHHLSIWHYHFARPDLGTDPRHEAEHFTEAVGALAGPRDYLVLDLERATPQGWSHDPAWSRAFDETVQARTRFASILYMSESQLMESDAWLVGKRKRVWVADWSAHPARVPQGYGMAARQFTDGLFGPEPHSAAGIGACDMSRVYLPAPAS